MMGKRELNIAGVKEAQYHIGDRRARRQRPGRQRHGHIRMPIAGRPAQDSGHGRGRDAGDMQFQWGLDRVSLVLVRVATVS